MLRPLLTASIALLAITFTASNAAALSYAYVPEDIRLMTADMVVVGTMGDVKQVEFSITGSLTITEVLKGKPEGKTIKMAWQDMSRFGGGKGHTNGQKGVWIISKNHKGDYATGYPGNRVSIDQTKRVKEALKKISELKWAESNGLALTYIAEMRDARGSRADQPDQPNPTARLTLYPVVRNTTKKTMRVCDFVPDKPFAVKMKTPTRSKVDGHLYPRPNNQKLNPRHFKTLEPGQVTMLGYGLHVPNITEIGKYQITVSFENKQDGKEFNLDDVWVGKLETETRTIATPGE